MGAHSRPQKRISEANCHGTPVLWLFLWRKLFYACLTPLNWMCAGAESVVSVFHGAFHPLRDGCLRLQLRPFCGSEPIPHFFDSKRPVLYQQHGALDCQKSSTF